MLIIYLFICINAFEAQVQLYNYNKFKQLFLDLVAHSIYTVNFDEHTNVWVVNCEHLK